MRAKVPGGGPDIGEQYPGLSRGATEEGSTVTGYREQQIGVGRARDDVSDAITDQRVPGGCASECVRRAFGREIFLDSRPVGQPVGHCALQVHTVVVGVPCAYLVDKVI